MEGAWTSERKAEQSERMSNGSSPFCNLDISGENHPMWDKHHTEKTKAQMSKRWTPERRQAQSEVMIGKKYHAKSFPAFVNVRTGQKIPAGVNLKKKCDECGIRVGPMLDLKLGHTKQSRDGWRLATKKERYEN